jgi:hypothetical protein
LERENFKDDSDFYSVVDRYSSKLIATFFKLDVNWSDARKLTTLFFPPIFFKNDNNESFTQMIPSSCTYSATTERIYKISCIEPKVIGSVFCRGIGAR